MAVKACMGVVHLGSSVPLGELRSWGTSGEADRIDVSIMGNCQKAFLAGPVQVTFRASVYTTQGDSGQALIVEGSTVAVEIFPEGTTTGKPRWTLSGDVLRREDTAEVDGAIEMNFEIAADNNGINRSGTAP